MFAKSDIDTDLLVAIVDKQAKHKQDIEEWDY